MGGGRRGEWERGGRSHASVSRREGWGLVELPRSSLVKSKYRLFQLLNARM